MQIFRPFLSQSNRTCRVLWPKHTNCSAPRHIWCIQPKQQYVFDWEISAETWRQLLFFVLHIFAFTSHSSRLATCFHLPTADKRVKRTRDDLNCVHQAQVLQWARKVEEKKLYQFDLLFLCVFKSHIKRRRFEWSKNPSTMRAQKKWQKSIKNRKLKIEEKNTHRTKIENFFSFSSDFSLFSGCRRRCCVDVDNQCSWIFQVNIGCCWSGMKTQGNIDGHSPIKHLTRCDILPVT